jgi:oligoribonuclease NrnB/cAMP/cGMP phosphodiesterase (DHH superfamily)
LKVYHLSHTDLDGFSCQFLVSLYFEDVTYYNSNYGKEILSNIEQIVNDIKNQYKKDIFIVISDLNLSVDNCLYLEECIKSLKDEFNIKLQLLDHHITGSECAQKFEWYYLDESRCATKITYDYLAQNYTPIKNIDHISKYVDCVNAIDIWLENETENFELGKVFNRAILESREVSKTIFPKEHISYKFFMIENSIKYINDENPTINLDENIYFMKKNFLRNGKENDTLDNLNSRYIVSLLENNKNKLTIKYKDHKGLLTFGVGNISVLANKFLKENDDYDFFMDVGFKGSVSFRADGKLDVSQLAKEKLDGGGHKNASGGKISNFEDIYVYSETKNIVESLLSE